MSKDLIVKNVPFNGVNMQAVQRNSDGKIFVVIKAICDGLGLDYSSQLKKIKSHKILKKHLNMFPLQTNGGIQNVNCIEKNCLDTWISGINENKKKRAFYGFVYLIDYGNNFYKIGYTSDIIQRFKTLSNCVPFDLKLIKYIRTYKAQEIEQKIHKIFKEQLLEGKKEFFKLNEIQFNYAIETLNVYHEG